MTCPSCASFEQRPTTGAYNFHCIACMARLIQSARPLRRLQQGHIAALQRFHGQAWTDIWPQVRQRLNPK